MWVSCFRFARDLRICICKCIRSNPDRYAEGNKFSFLYFSLNFYKNYFTHNAACIFIILYMIKIAIHVQVDFVSYIFFFYKKKDKF